MLSMEMNQEKLKLKYGYHVKHNFKKSRNCFTCLSVCLCVTDGQFYE